MKQAIYNKKDKTLSYWRFKDTYTKIKCLNYGCAKFAIFIANKIDKVKQELTII